MGNDFLSVSAAAALLGVTTRAVRYRLESGVLEGRQGASGRWEVSAVAVQDRLSAGRGSRFAARAVVQHDDTSVLLEVAMLRAERTELSARVELLEAKNGELRRELERSRAIGVRLVEAVHTALQSPGAVTGESEEPF